MLEEKDLQAIAQLIDQKLDPIKADISGIKTRLDVEVSQQFNLLAEGQRDILDALTPKSEIEVLKGKVEILEIAVRSMNKALSGEYIDIL